MLDVLRRGRHLDPLGAEEFFRMDGTLAARVSSAGGWLDLSRRKLIAPPAELLAALRMLPRTDDFQVLHPLIK